MKDNRIPAFPVHPAVKGEQYSGMSLRDYFAAKAMQGILSSQEDGISYTWDKIAKDSYKLADIMLKVRE